MPDQSRGSGFSRDGSADRSQTGCGRTLIAAEAAPTNICHTPGQCLPPRGQTIAEDLLHRAGDGLPTLANAYRQQVGTQVATLASGYSRKHTMDPVLGVHAYALTLRAQRAEVLAANLANADTPGFKARDFDFSETLGRAKGAAMVLKASRPQHTGDAMERATESLAYRNPYQPSLDGNTVEAEEELARFAENSVAYQASLMFVNGRIRGLRAAITGAQ